MSDVDPVMRDLAKHENPPRTFADDYTDGKVRLCEWLPPLEFRDEAEELIYELLTGQSAAAEKRAKAMLGKAVELWENDHD